MTGVDAAVMALGGGDIDGALAILEQPIGGVSSSDRPEALVRLHWHLLILAGRAGDAAELTADLDPVPGMAAPRELSDVARWLDGDPTGLTSGDVDLSPDRYRRLSERDTFDQAAFIAVIAASAPDPGPVHHACDLLDASPFAVTSGPDGALTTAARACRAVVDHDDGAAAAVVTRFVEAGPLDPLTDAHLRRSLAVPYVCSPELRRGWDAADLGPSQQRARAAARLLARPRGRAPCPPPRPRCCPRCAPRSRFRGRWSSRPGPPPPGLHGAPTWPSAWPTSWATG